MDDKLFRELDANLKEAVNVSKGTSAPKSVYVMLTPANINTSRRRFMYWRAWDGERKSGSPTTSISGVPARLRSTTE